MAAILASVIGTPSAFAAATNSSGSLIVISTSLIELLLPIYSSILRLFLCLKALLHAQAFFGGVLLFWHAHDLKPRMPRFEIEQFAVVRAQLNHVLAGGAQPAAFIAHTVTEQHRVAFEPELDVDAIAHVALPFALDNIAVDMLC